MTYLKIKRFDEKHGRVRTALPNCRHYRDIQELTAMELAQLCCDLFSLPQDKLRPGEAKNLLKLLLRIGREKYGSIFNRQVAIQFMQSL